MPTSLELQPVDSVLVIGAGWYGCHIAAEIKRASPETKVVIFERNSQIFSEISGKFGIRLHAGPHYPRSSTTRQFCHDGFLEFLAHYPELVNHQSYSHYGLGIKDVNGQPPKVNKETFHSVCQEFQYVHEVDLESSNYQSLQFVANLKEPSLVVGEGLRQFFKNYLQKLGVEIYCHSEVQNIQKTKCAQLSTVKVTNGKCYHFQHVINATSFKSLLPQINSNRQLTAFPVQGEVVYQSCIVLTYKYIAKKASPKLPFSFIVMDGWYPCILPFDSHAQNSTKQIDSYIFIHGKWTILGSFSKKEEAEALQASITDVFILTKIKPECEADMKRYWPEFGKLFRFSGWKGDVQAKLKTDTEFRTALAFRSKLNEMTYVFPGKVNNIFQVGREVLTLLGVRKGKIIDEEQFSYVADGLITICRNEINQKPLGFHQNTCELQTFNELASPLP